MTAIGLKETHELTPRLNVRCARLFYHLWVLFVQCDDVTGKFNDVVWAMRTEQSSVHARGSPQDRTSDESAN